MKNNYLQGLRKKILSSLLVSSLLISLVQPFAWVNATVSDSPGNTIMWTNNNYVNSTNSGAYAVNFMFSWTLDANDTVRVTATNGSGNTATGSYNSLLGWESSGSLNIDFSTPPWSDWLISYDAIVYSGGVSSQITASGITSSGILDATAPGITLSSTATGTITGSIMVAATTSEALLWFSGSDVLVTNGTPSGFTQTSSTGYTFTVTPTMSGMVTVSVGTGMATDMAGNLNNASNILTYSYSGTDMTAPVVIITSHASGATVTGSPVLSGTVTDTESSITSVTVNGNPATFWSGTFSKTLTGLTPGANTLVVIATDAAGNTWSTSTVLNRVPLASNPNATLSGPTSAIVTFNTDITATGVVRYGTLSGALLMTATGTSSATSHAITLSGLSLDTTYYYAVLGQGWPQSSTMQFRTASVVGNNSSWAIVAIGAIYLSGWTSTWVTFTNSGTITVTSISSSWSSIFFPFNWLTITASGGGWDDILYAPEISTASWSAVSLSGFTFMWAPYRVGSSTADLVYSGQVATIALSVSPSYSGQTLMVYRSTNQWATYTPLTSCIVTGWKCTFTTNRLWLFDLAAPSGTLPNTFTFTGVTNAELSTIYTSSPTTLSGFNSGTMISVTGGEYRVNSGAFTTASGIVNPGDSVTIRGTSSAANSTTSNVTLTVGSGSATFSITTKAAAGSGGGGSGGGGGGTPIVMDNCPNGDTSPSYYDGRCTPTTNNTGTVTNPPPIVVNNGFNIPPIIIGIADIKFRDISSNWARAYIIKLVIRGIVDNVAYYNPNTNLSRAEFLKIVINTTGWVVPTTNLNIPFNDVSTNTWYAKYVSLALSKGMIRSDTRFRPNDSITRAEATKILMVTLWVNVMDPPIAMTFVDVNYNSDLAKYIETAVSLQVASGQMRGGNRIFRPNDPITRAEIAKVVVNTFGL